MCPSDSLVYALSLSQTHLFALIASYLQGAGLVASSMGKYDA